MKRKSKENSQRLVSDQQRRYKDRGIDELIGMFKWAIVKYAECHPDNKPTIGEIRGCLEQAIEYFSNPELMELLDKLRRENNLI